MARQTVNPGTGQQADDGDFGFDAWTKQQANEAELYARPRDMGEAATFAALPTDADIKAGDTARLTVDDGANLKGTYRYDGAAYQPSVTGGGWRWRHGCGIAWARLCAGWRRFR